MANPESIYVRLAFHEDSSERERDHDYAYLFEALDQLMQEASAFKFYKVLTNEDPLPPHF